MSLQQSAYCGKVKSGVFFNSTPGLQSGEYACDSLTGKDASDLLSNFPTKISS
jgi:hypothetical protein